MRTSPAAPLSRAARLPRALLIALALCACRGGDDPEKRADSQDPAQNTAVQDPAAGSCTPPPTVDPALFQKSWAELGQHLQKASFPVTALNSATREVRLCDSCAVATLTIHAEAGTRCTNPADLTGEPRVMAIFVLASDFPGDPKRGWGKIAKGDSIYAFASDTFGAATLAYRDSLGGVATAPSSYWAFYYCKDDHIPAGDTLAQWRDRGLAPATQAAQDKGKAKGKDDEEEENGSYGWMACASGCCQFYTPPPNQGNEDDDDDGNGRPRGRTGDQRQVEPGPIPYWCNPKT